MKHGTLQSQSDVNTFLTTGAKRQSRSDLQVHGLQLERLGKRRGRWRLRYTPKDRAGRRSMTLGDAPALTLADARMLAQEALRKAAMGTDPYDERQAAKQVPTFAAFVDEQYLPYVKTYKKTWDTDVSLLKNHLLPRFGHRLMDAIHRPDIVKMHHERRAAGAAPGSANRLLILMRYIFNLALRWETPGIKTNPCHQVPLMPENNKRERYLSDAEAQRLAQAVCASSSPMLRYIIPMLLLTGARKREVLDARWQDFDLARRLWRIPTPKSGKARHVPLSDGAMALLACIPQVAGCPYPFANPATGKPYVAIFYPWDTARRRAGLADVRLHDLRHSFASLLINQGRTLYEVQHLLGHTQARTTQRYAHLSHDTLLEAANVATQRIGHLVLPALPQ